METTKADALSELLERVEKATGADRELDGVIAAAFGKKHGPFEFIEDRSFISTPEIAEPYTSSLDAALALVNEKLPGEFWTTQHADGGFAALLSGTPSSGPLQVQKYRGDGRSAPLALLEALLRALIAERS